jgi:DNA invertase Pin-like site-specific DNA recombinase
MTYIEGAMKDNRAVGYVRVSTEEQVSQGLSIPAQKEAIVAYARMRGLELVDVIVDAGVSGGRALGTRPGGQKLLSLLAEGRASHIIALRLDRLFRDAADCLATVETWTRKGFVLHLLDVGGNSIDTSSAAGKFMLTILAAVAEMERNLIAERIRNVLSWKRRNGKVFSHPPFGFARDGDDLVPVEAEQKALDLILDLRARGYSLRKIAKTLEARGIPTKRGGRWAAATVRKLLARAEGDALCLAKI